MPQDLRSFLKLLEKEFPDELIRVSKGPLNLAEGEPVALLYHLMRQGKRPLMVCENVTTLKGNRWEGMVAFQLAGTWTKIGAAYGIPRQKMDLLTIQTETVERVRRSTSPLLLERSQAPVKERIVRGKEIDLFDLPAYRANEKDARPGNMTGVLIAKDPDSGRYNLSWHRNTLQGPDRMTTAITGVRHIGDIARAYQRRGFKEFPVAQLFGHHVLVGLAAAIRADLEVDEYAFAGGLLGEPLRLTPSEEWGEELLVPADGEVVIEGYISTSEQAEAGHWGDHFLYYTPVRPHPLMRVVSITMRRCPIFEHTWVGQYVYSDIAHSSLLRAFLLTRFSGVGPINPVSPYTYIVQFKPRHPGDVRRLASMAHGFSSHVKHLIIVDEDVDPFDLPAVFWSLGARVDATRQVHIVPNLTGERVDPSAQEGLNAHTGVGGLIIDGTEPIGRPFLEMARPDPALLSRVRLQEYLSEQETRSLASGHTTRPWGSLQEHPL